MVPPAKKSYETRIVRFLKTRPQVRKTFPPESDLRALARSVMKRQIHPFIIVLPDDVILDGECRYRGLMLENPDFEVEVIVVDRDLEPGELGELQLISALHSNTLTPYDQAVACRDWMMHNPGSTAKVLADRIDRDPSMLTRLNSLWNTAPSVVAAAAEGKIGPKAWYQISLVPESDRPGLLEMYLAGVPSDQIAQIGRDKRRLSPVPPSPKSSRIVLPLAGGTRIVVSGPEMSLAELIEKLGAAIEAAKRANKDSLDIRTAEKVWKDKVRNA